MAFIKKHLFLLLCGVIVLAGLGLLFLGNLMASENAEKVAEVKQQCDQVAKLRSQLVTEGELTRLKQISQQAVQLSNQVETQALQSSRRPLLSTAIFPLRNTSGARLYYGEFAQAYTASVNELLASMQAGTPPSAEEIEKLITRTTVGAQRGAGQMGMPPDMGMGMGMPMDGGGGMGARSEQERERMQLIESAGHTRAQEISIYATPAAFCAYEHWKSEPTADNAVMAKESWFTQLAAWIQEDVVLSINELNAGSTSVFESPIKRFIGVTYAGDVPAATATVGGASATRRATGMTVRSAGAADRHIPGSEVILPAYVCEAAASTGGRPGGMGRDVAGGKLPGSMVDAYTARKCNDLIDIVHFKVAVVLDGDHLYDFINALQSKKGEPGNERNQITVLTFDVQPVDVAAENASGYYYGQGKFVVARLTCEYFFFDRGYQDYMPQQVKDILSPPAGAAASPGGMGHFGM